MTDENAPHARAGRILCRLFPLPGVVLLPRVVLPLHIFEPRYRQLMADALADDHRITIIQTSSRVHWPLEGEPELEEVGCLGLILTHERLPDGTFNLLLQGQARVRLARELDRKTLYRRAEMELMPEVEADDPGRRRARELACAARRLPELARDPDVRRWLERETSLGILTDWLVHALALPPAVKQAFLSEPRVAVRAEYLGRILRESQAVSGATHRSPGPAPPFSLN